MTDGPRLELTSQERSIIYLGERVRMLRAEIYIAEKAVDDGHGDLIVPVIELPLRVHLEQLRLGLEDAQADLEHLTQLRGSLQ